MEKSIMEAINKLSAKVEAVTMSIPKIELNEKTLKLLEKKLNIYNESYGHIKIIDGLEVVINEEREDWHIYLVPSNDNYILYGIDNKLEW